MRMVDLNYTYTNKPINARIKKAKSRIKNDMVNAALEGEIIPAGEEEAIRELYSGYGRRDDEYLVEGAILTCDKAVTDVKIIRGQIFSCTELGDEAEKKKTILKVSTNQQEGINGMLIATVEDCKKGENIIPFQCNCAYEPFNDKEEEEIFSDLENCKQYGTCRKLMKLENKWENIIRETKYFTFNSISEKGKKVEGITMTSILFCSHGGIITPMNSGQIILDLRTVFAGFNIEEYLKNDNELAKKLAKLDFSQDKVDMIFAATQAIYESYNIVIDPVSLLAIIAQEGTGSFNTSSTNLAADGQHGFEKDFAIDLMKANNLIFGKTLGYILYGEQFMEAVDNNKNTLAVRQGNYAQYANWITPIVDLPNQTIRSGCYAMHSKWHENVSKFYESVRGEGGMEEYSNYISSIDKKIVCNLMEDNGIKMQEGDFCIEQNGQNYRGEQDGTYTIVWKSK